MLADRGGLGIVALESRDVLLEGVHLPLGDNLEAVDHVVIAKVLISRELVAASAIWRGGEREGEKGD